MLCLNNSLFGFGIVKVLLGEDLEIRVLLFKIVGSNIFWILVLLEQISVGCVPQILLQKSKRG